MGLTLTAETRVAAAPDLLASNLNGEVVILHVGRGRYYGLDSVGSCIWEMLAQPVTVSELHQALLKDYDVDPEHCRRDLLDLLGQLAGEGLIEVIDGIPA